ncbi:hypothetical protein V6N13_118337 [Hibiscus sabdariffa]|uniref:Uncharacterized protein n=1 Tax=Hibiscus sabdariffa TaxID=183260 RepID=A0ABR2Q8L0_9ROSI
MKTVREILFLEDEELLGRDFSIKRAKILTDSMNFIEERVLLSCNGTCFTVLLREFSAGDRSSLELDVCGVKNDSPLDGFIKVAGAESFSPASSSSSSPGKSKQEQVGNV